MKVEIVVVKNPRGICTDGKTFIRYEVTQEQMNKAMEEMCKKHKSNTPKQ